MKKGGEITVTRKFRKNILRKKGMICMKYTYTPQGVCSRQMEIEVEEGIVKSLRVIGGCNGNLQGISKLVEGMKIEDVIEKLKGIDCGGRGTSCPDQLAKALEEINK